MGNREALETLAEDLAALVEVLRRDPGCAWTRHLASCLSTAEALLASGFEREAASALAGSVMCIYGGAGSFNDYAPVTRVRDSGRLELLPGMEAVDALAGKVYRSALSLRTVGQV